MNFDSEFNFVIARGWPNSNGALAAYMVHGSEIHFGSEKDANALLKYVQKK